MKIASQTNNNAKISEVKHDAQQVSQEQEDKYKNILLIEDDCYEYLDSFNPKKRRFDKLLNNIFIK